MDNDDATIGTILSRREMMQGITRGTMGLALAPGLFSLAEASYQARSQRDVKLIASPALTEGPFFVDEKLNRSDLTTETSRPSVVSAAPLALNLKVLSLKDGKFSPLSNAIVDLWQADAHGTYSDESNPMNPENTASQKWLRGYQKADMDGLARFKTIIPGWYRGRTAHIHFKIRITGDASHREFTSQLFFNDTFADKVFEQSPYWARTDQDIKNHGDNIFCEGQLDGSLAGDHLTLEVLPDPSGKGYRSTFVIALTERSLGRPGRGGFGGPPPPPPDF